MKMALTGKISVVEKLQAKRAKRKSYEFVSVTEKKKKKKKKENQKEKKKKKKKKKQ
jgi:hypothetical protein